MPECPLLELAHVRFAYAGGPAVFDDLCFSLHEGEHIGIHAPNGSGKTTLFRLMTGLEKPQGGSILFHGRPVENGQTLHELRCAVGFVLQNSDDQLFSSTVLEEVAFGPLNLGMNRTEARARAMETLESMGMAEFAGRPIHRLSGGEKKMVAIASVLSMRTKALLLDEPTTFLDEISRERIITLLRGQDIARVIVSHDRDFLRQTTSAVMTIDRGRMSKSFF